MGAQTLKTPRPRSRRPADPDRLLVDTQGYRVDGPGGRIGFVDEVRHDGGNSVLAVRAGLLGRRIFLFPTSDVAFIVPRAKQIQLSSTAAPLATERAA